MVLLPGKDADAVALLPAVPEAAAEGNGGVAPEWPQVKCHSCPNIDKWKRMRSVKEVVHFQESLTDREDVVWWTYTCVPCVAREMNLTETEALAHVKQSMSTPAFCRKRNMEFRAAFADRREEFPGLSHEGIRRLAREDVADVIAPLGEFVSRKLVQLQARARGIEEYDRLVAELKETKDKQRELTIIEALEMWDSRLEQLCQPLAFSDKPDATQMFNVAQYSDEWVNTKTGSLRAWYVCLQDWGGTWGVCGTVMPSKQWKRKFEDVGASKQRWYCVCCQTRFRTSYGMLVEVHTRGVSTFMLAEVSNRDVEDVRAMFLEKELKPKNHRDLWEKIPDFTPMDPQEILRPVKPHELAITEGFDVSLVSKFVNVDGLKKVPKWDWDQIFSLLTPTTPPPP